MNSLSMATKQKGLQAGEFTEKQDSDHSHGTDKDAPPLLVDHDGLNNPANGEECKDGQQESGSRENQQLKSPLASESDGQNADLAEDDAIPQTQLTSASNDSATIEQATQRSQDPLLTQEASENLPHSQTVSPLVTTKSYSQSKPNNNSQINQEIQEMINLTQTPSNPTRDNNEIQRENQTLPPLQEIEQEVVSSNDIQSEEHQQPKSSEPIKPSLKFNNQTDQRLHNQLPQFHSEMSEISTQKYEEMLLDIIKNEVALQLAEQLVETTAQDNCSATMSDYFSNCTRNRIESEGSCPHQQMPKQMLMPKSKSEHRPQVLVGLKKKGHVMQQETGHMHVDTNLSKQQESILRKIDSDEPYTAQQQARQSPVATLSKRIQSHQTEFQPYRKQTQANIEMKEISSESDYRSAFSQALHNDLEPSQFLQNQTVQERKKSLHLQFEKKKSEDPRALSRDYIANGKFPNIFDKKDSILSENLNTSEISSPTLVNTRRLLASEKTRQNDCFDYDNQLVRMARDLSRQSDRTPVSNLNKEVQTDLQENQAAPAPFSIATQTTEEMLIGVHRMQELTIQNIITDFTLDPRIGDKIQAEAVKEIERSANYSTDRKELNSQEASPQSAENAKVSRIQANQETGQEMSPVTDSFRDYADIVVNSSDSGNSAASFEIKGMMVPENTSEHENEKFFGEPKSPAQFTLTETRKQSENQISGQESIQQNFINALGIASKDNNPVISIRKLESTDKKGQNPFQNIDVSARNRGQNTSGSALPTTMTFGDLSPDLHEYESPGTKRARALTFNQDNNLIITKFDVKCESKKGSKLNLMPTEERKGTESSDNDKNQISGQKKSYLNFNTKTPKSAFDSTTDSTSQRHDQQQMQTPNYNLIQATNTTQNKSIGLMQGNPGATTFNKNYKIYSQSPQFMPTIKRPLDSPYQPLPQAIKPTQKSTFLMLNESSPSSDTNASRNFHSAQKEGNFSCKTTVDSRKDFKQYDQPTFQRTLTERDNILPFKEDEIIGKHANPTQPNLLFQPKSTCVSGGDVQAFLALKAKQSTKTDVGHSTSAPAHTNSFKGSEGQVEVHHCDCCEIGKALRNKTNGSPRTSLGMQQSNSTPKRRMSGEKYSMIEVVEFDDQQDLKTEAPKYNIVAKPQEVWPILETGRQAKTFDQVRLLGEGAFGSVFQVRHKLDEQIYALKKIQMHLHFDPSELPESRKRSLLSHPAMKEIEAISKLGHKNIVGYKGCWVEAGTVDETRMTKIQAKQLKRKMRRITNGADLSLKDGIDERDDDDSEWEFDVKENEELNAQFEMQSDLIYNNDSDSNRSNSDSGSFHSAKNNSDSESQYYSESGDEEEQSDVGSDSSIYQLVEKKESFARLNVMILMEYAEGEALSERIDKSGSNGLHRKVIYQLFEQLMQALKYIHSQGLIHRDIKPDNIFVNLNTGRLQVGDFGLAKRMKVLGEAPEGLSPTLKHVRSSAGLREGNKDMYMNFNRQTNSSTSSSNPFKQRRSSDEKGFKINKISSKEDRDSSDGSIQGTLMYLSPEMRPQPKTYDADDRDKDLKTKRSQQLARAQARDKVDIYAAGLVLFEMCGNFTTDMERMMAYEGLQKRREFPKGFTDKFYQESQIISMMTEPIPQKRPSASFFLNKSPEFQCYGFDLKIKDFF